VHDHHGRILSDRWPRLPGGKDAGELFESTADSFGIGAWLVGTTTMREFAGRDVRLKKARRRVKRTDHIADRRARRSSSTGAVESRPSSTFPATRRARRPLRYGSRRIAGFRAE